MNWLHWALFSALFAGLTAVLAKAGVKGIDSNLATAIRTVVILIFAWSIALSRGFDTLSKATTRTWLFLILSGLATGASWLCYFRALQLGEASKVAPLDKLSVRGRHGSGRALFGRALDLATRDWRWPYCGRHGHHCENLEPCISAT